MQKSSSMIAGASRGICVNVVTPAAARRSSGARPLVRSILRRARRWMAGRRADIQIISVQRSDYSIIT